MGTRTSGSGKRFHSSKLLLPALDECQANKMSLGLPPCRKPDAQHREQVFLFDWRGGWGIDKRSAASPHPIPRPLRPVLC